MILFNTDILQNILLDSYIKKNTNIDILIKNNYVYIPNDRNFEIPNIKSHLISNVDDYIYYYLNNKLNNILSFEDFYPQKFIEFSDNINCMDFSPSDDAFFSKGNVVILYFSTPYINNPLDVLSTFINSISLENEYSDVLIDYLPYNNKLVYYILFRYSNYLKSNLFEILRIIDLLKESSEIVQNRELFPDIQIAFQNELFKKSTKIETLNGILSYEGIRIFEPFHKIHDFRRK